MTCEEFEAQLTAFSLGELEPDDAMGARAHVARCDACAAATLRDRQLTALLRASMVEMPAEGQTAVLAAVRSEATWAPLPAPSPAAAAAPGTRMRRHQGRRSRRHWLALAAAAVLTLAVLALAVVLVPAPDRSSAIAAGWNLYRQGNFAGKQPSADTTRRLDSALGAAARPPDLRGFGLQSVGWDGRMLAGHLASVAEYRDVAGRRVTLMRWHGELPHPTRGSPEFASLRGHADRAVGRHRQRLVQERRRRLLPGRDGGRAHVDGGRPLPRRLVAPSRPPGGPRPQAGPGRPGQGGRPGRSGLTVCRAGRNCLPSSTFSSGQEQATPAARWNARLERPTTAPQAG